MLTDFTYADLIGRPFRYDGRGPEDYDCWGAVMELYDRWHGVKLPDYQSSDDLARNARLMLAEGQRLWTKLERPAPGSVICMSIRSIGCHVGFVVSPTKFVHALEGRPRQVMVERLNRRFRILGAYLYAGHERH